MYGRNQNEDVMRREIKIILSCVIDETDSVCDTIGEVHDLLTNSDRPWVVFDEMDYILVEHED